MQEKAFSPTRGEIGWRMRHRPPDQHRNFARSMRADATMAENMLWQALRRNQLEGFKFKRQVPLKGYILDFVCFERKLIVEVDGGQHSENTKDEARDRHFAGDGFETLRFWNHEVEKNLDGVCDHILHRLRDRADRE